MVYHADSQYPRSQNPTVPIDRSGGKRRIFHHRQWREAADQGDSAGQMRRLGFIEEQSTILDDFDSVGAKEIAIKLRFGRSGFRSMQEDPFDGILVSQTTVEEISLLTSGALVVKYPRPVRQV